MPMSDTTLLRHSARPHIAVVLGTRPEYLKLAPVVLELRQHRELLDTTVILTGQHRELLSGLPELFDMADCRQLGVANQQPDLASLTAALLTALDAQFARERPSAVVVQGDTTTAFAAALAAFYRQIPVAHVEAGLRTYRLDQPFPEELNRQMVGRIATWHFPPTRDADQQLAAESVPAAARQVTGNTIVDTLQLVLTKKLPNDYAERLLPHEAPELAQALARRPRGQRRPLVLLTVHRRENQGPQLGEFFAMIRRVAARHPELDLVYPYHLNPAVRQVALEQLADLPGVHLMPPLPYRAMLFLMQQVDFALSDSGGLQEELPSFGKPLLVLRTSTERPEVVAAGMAQLVGLQPAVVEPALEDLLAAAARGEDPQWFHRGPNPFGDGRAAQRIVARLLTDLVDLPPRPARGQSAVTAAVRAVGSNAS
ncbi:MAG: UDP-N-acetylglucosamine 2-epimerase (non-hydrolyzing) [Deltaproteobacteria bacterium]|nr:UDP-N-acetylglucosamine 2-epimerase (non-hydrolyzing) [Deltaproteobacteria bacterium]